MERFLMNEKELSEEKVGAAITLAGVMGIIVIAVMAIVIFKLFMSSSGKTTIPGGFKFEWN